MKITQEDIDNIVTEIKSSGSIHNSWNKTFNYIDQVNFLWEMYKELTKRKGE